MKESELRIGNLIFDNHREIVVDVDINILRSITNNNPCLYKPIPLTEEWLLKFGFEKLNTKMSDCFVFQKGLWRVAIKDNIEKTYEWVLWHERISPPTWCLSRFEYLHQLQNLYFSLTGEELTVKESSNE
jgi:hypothetical protein